MPSAQKRKGKARSTAQTVKEQTNEPQQNRLLHTTEKAGQAVVENSSGAAGDKPTEAVGDITPEASVWVDGATESPAGAPKITNTRVELPAECYATGPLQIPHRPAGQRNGKVIKIRINQFKLTSWTDKNIFQYEVLVGSGNEKRGKVLKVWNSKAVQNKLKALDNFWLFDGARIAWCSKDAGAKEAVVSVNLDEESGREPRNGRSPDICRVVIKKTTQINMAVINAYLKGQLTYVNHVGEALNFLDHLLRQNPSERLITVKRSFFGPGEQKSLLNNSYVEAIKGVYASIRLCPLQGSVSQSLGLGVNVDVANGTFWLPGKMHFIACRLGYLENTGTNWDVFAKQVQPVCDEKGRWSKSRYFQELNKLKGLRFTVSHRGRKNDTQIYTVKSVYFDIKYAGEGATARNVTFETLHPKTGEKVEISVAEYFRVKYNINLEFPHFPLIEAVRGGLFPMEACTIAPNQKYTFKLDPKQTADMIKFAATRPKQRLASLRHGLSLLDWVNDPYLKYYGVKIDSNMTPVSARLLQPPEVQFANGKATPGTSGRWDLRGKKFLRPNTTPLKNWGVCICQNAIDVAAARNFVKVFVTAYINHGGQVPNRDPIVFNASEPHYGKVASSAFEKVQAQCNARPEFILFILPDKNSGNYERLKKNMDCRYGIVSQMIQRNHARSAQPQYCSNVAMKVNAKLGGTTARIPGGPGGKPAHFTVPTMIIGADVSHAAPMIQQASMAAMTVSMDMLGCRYAAAVQTNGFRVEMITESNIREMLLPLLANWVKTIGNGSGPQHIYYMRDGVSEGQFQQVLDDEVAKMKKIIGEKFPKAVPKFTVIICGKRHHIRFFPEQGAGDRNENPLPGTVVDTDVVHPFQWDFYLNSHSAIQGTARPVHYSVILDEANVNPNALEGMIYQQCYQYMRSTTPVSLHPAVYYAHIASLRARSHEDAPSSEGPRGGQQGVERRLERATFDRYEGKHHDPGRLDVKPLVPLGPPAFQPHMALQMWFI